MAWRSIRDLERLALVDYRFYLGNISDYSGNGNDGVWGAAVPQFKRSVGGVVGLEWDLGIGNQIVSTPAISITDAFAFEIVMYSRTNGGAGAGRIIEATTGAISVRWNGANLYFACGVAWNLLYGQGISHLIVSRDGSDDGRIYDDSWPNGPTAVGGNDLAGVAMQLGNNAALNRSFDGAIFAMRIYNDYIDPDEAARLYEHSRIQLWPGAPKRSGIVSPVV